MRQITPEHAKALLAKLEAGETMESLLDDSDDARTKAKRGGTGTFTREVVGWLQGNGAGDGMLTLFVRFSLKLPSKQVSRVTSPLERASMSSVV